MQHRLVNAIFVASDVVAGFGRGSKKLGFPTANLEEEVVQGLTLDNGIYYGFAQLVHKPNSELHKIKPCESTKSDKDFVVLDTSLNNPIYPMVCSLGFNPHFNNKNRSLEVHILHNFGYNFYGSLIRVAICGFIRSEKKFNSFDELIQAIQSDIHFAKQVLREPEKTWSHVITDRYFYV